MLVADAHALFGIGVVTVLRAAGMAVETVEPDEAVARAVARDAAGLVLDAGLGTQPYARDLVADALAASPGLAVVLVVDRIRPAGLVDVMESGARALIHRRCTPEELVTGVSAALHGQNWVSAPLAGPLRAELLSEAAGDRADALTAREREVLRGLAAGGTNAAIARRLGISEHTVRNHVHSLLGKLGVANRTDAVTTAMRRGLVELSD